MGPYAGVDYNLTLYPLQCRLQHIYHGQPYSRADRNPMPESTLSPGQGLWIWPQQMQPRLCVAGRNLVCSSQREDESQGWANLDQAHEDLDRNIFRDLSPTPKP
jgi:hypothetical protein